MGEINQYEFVKSRTEIFNGPFLEVGSRDYGSTPNLRELFPEETYVGLDMSEGKSVDLVLDLTLPFDQIDNALNAQRFNTIFCLSVLEHVDKPFVMAENLTRLLQSGGKIFISAPFAWKFHGYPSDYWRFTHEGIKKLFPELKFSEEYHSASGPKKGDYRNLDETIGLLPMTGGGQKKAGYFLRSLSVRFLRLLSLLGIYRWLTQYRYLMQPTMINMVGIKK